MKKIFLISTVLGLSAFLSSCDLGVLTDPKAISIDASQTPTGAYQSTLSALKRGFDAHQNMAWAAGFIANEELQTLSATSSFPSANNIEAVGKLQEDNGQNTTIAQISYTSLSFADNARKATASVSNASAKALLLANINMIEGVVYGDWSKFYPEVPEAITGKKLAALAARDKAIGLLQEAIRQMAAVSATTEIGIPTTGLYTDAAQVTKFCNAYIAMLYFDTGEKAKAGEFLSKSYTAADAGKELGYKILNTTTGDGLYPWHRNWVEFSVNKYSDKFRNSRIVGDTLRRTAREYRWWAPFTGAAANDNLRIAFNYFFPQSTVSAPSPAGSPQVPQYPVITRGEVVLMQADPTVGQVTATAAMTEVMRSWNMTAAMVTAELAKPDVTLDRVARYEYMGRGRRWPVVSSSAKWDLPLEFKF
jgi:hypothetical protein